MRFIFILCFLFSFNVLAQKAPSGTTLAYINIYYESLSSVDLGLSKDKNGLVDNLALKGAGKGILWTKESSVKPLREIRKDFISNSMTIKFSFSGDHLKKFWYQLSNCSGQSQGQFYGNKGMNIKAAVFWRNDNLEKTYKSNKSFPIDLEIAPDYGFECYTP